MTFIQIEVFYSFFDLKDYISYCKDVYRYFNLSSVNFFVAGLNNCLFCSMALWQ